MLFVELTVRKERAHRIWQALVTMLNQEELAALVNWARAVSALGQTIDPDEVRMPQVDAGV